MENFPLVTSNVIGKVYISCLSFVVVVLLLLLFILFFVVVVVVVFGLFFVCLVFVGE